MPPTANNMFFNARGKGRVKTTAYKNWSDENAWKLKALGFGMLTGRVRVDIILPQNSRRDIDNSIKPLLDCLQASGVLQNDRQVRALWVREAVRDDVLVRIAALADDERCAA